MVAFFVGRKRMRPELDISVSELSHLIDEWIYSERDRAILKRRLLDGITYEKIAEEFELSPRQVNTIIYKGTQRLVVRLPCKETAQNLHESHVLASC